MIFYVVLYVTLTDSNNRLIIMEYDPARDDGTYICRAENIAGIDSAVLSLASSKLVICSGSLVTCVYII